MMRNKFSSNEKTIRALLMMAVFVVAYYLQMLIWVGAEWCYLGAVATTPVDAVVNFVLAMFVTRQLLEWAALVSKARRIAAAGGEQRVRRNPQA